MTTQQGVMCIGGLDVSGPVATVFLLQHNESTPGVRILPLSGLPAARANAAAAYCGGWVYVAGGDLAGRGTSTFWRIGSADGGNARWEELPTWPGPARFGAVLAVLQAEGREQLFLFGGRIEAVGRAHLSEFLFDGYAFDPVTKQWCELTDMPDRALLAAALRIGRSRLAILGGSNGQSLERMAELGERYRVPNRILVYDAEADAWETCGHMPVGVVAPAVAGGGDHWIVAGGEYSPGLRTPQTFRVTLARGGAR